MLKKQKKTNPLMVAYETFSFPNVDDRLNFKQVTWENFQLILTKFFAVIRSKSSRTFRKELLIVNLLRFRKVIS